MGASSGRKSVTDKSIPTNKTTSERSRGGRRRPPSVVAPPCRPAMVLKEQPARRRDHSPRTTGGRLDSPTGRRRADLPAEPRDINQQVAPEPRRKPALPSVQLRGAHRRRQRFTLLAVRGERPVEEGPQRRGERGGVVQIARVPSGRDHYVLGQRLPPGPRLGAQGNVAEMVQLA